MRTYSKLSLVLVLCTLWGLGCGDDSSPADALPIDAGDAMVDGGDAGIAPETGPIMLRFDIAQASDQW